MMTQTELINAIVTRGAQDAVTDIEFLGSCLSEWKDSRKRRMMIDGERYYRYDQDILKKKRKAIGADGKIKEVHNLPNNRIIDNSYTKLVDQIVDYSVGKPFTVTTDEDAYSKVLAKIFNNRFRRMFASTARAAVNEGIAWILPYAENDELRFKRFEGYEVLPFWADSEHTILDCAARSYEVEVYKKDDEKETVEYVELFTKTGIKYFVWDGGKLIPDAQRPDAEYLRYGDMAYDWMSSPIPLIAIKHNAMEIPLIKRTKSLQDAINSLMSDWMDNMQENKHNCILVVKNYGGQDSAELRNKLIKDGVINITDIPGTPGGGVDTLQIEVNADNYERILHALKKAIIENARGYDAKDERMSGQPNQMNIQSMYSDIDLGANDFETQMTAAFEELMLFVDDYLKISGNGDFAGTTYEVKFNRNVLINTGEMIDNCKKSDGMISQETLLKNHPFVDNVQDEMKRLEKEKQAEQDAIDQAQYPGVNGNGNDEAKQ